MLQPCAKPGEEGLMTYEECLGLPDLVHIGVGNICSRSQPLYVTQLEPPRVGLQCWNYPSALSTFAFYST